VKWIKLFFVMIFSAILLSMTVFAAAPYDTYTYSYEGKMQVSPNAYLPKNKITNFGEAGTLNAPGDIIKDEQGNIVIADTDNNRVVVLNKNYETVTLIGSFTAEDKEDSLKAPRGVYSAGGMLYVADTENARIVVFDKEYKFNRIIEAPSASILPDNFIFKPRAVAVDRAGHIYVVSMNTNMGVLALDRDGKFEGFVGAQRVTANPIELFWRMFMSEAQLERSNNFVPMEYKNLTMDAKGFVYVVTSSIDRYSLFSAINSRSGASTYAPVKKINSAGTDVLRRNGFYPPVGDVNFKAYPNAREKGGPSSIIEVCLLDNEMYLIVDENQSKMFVYDSYGNLMYAFGGNGTVLGLFRSLVSVAYIDGQLLALDTLDNSITVFEKTEYGHLLDEVVTLEKNREFDKSAELWQEVIINNNNFDMAYLGIGKSQLEQSRYKEAMGTFKLFGNKEYYSKAYNLHRQEQLDKYGMGVLFIVIVAIIGLVWLFKAAKKYNRSRKSSAEKRTIFEELAYSLHVIFHPFDGFWDIKHDNRGSVRSATVLLSLTALFFVVRDFSSGYLSSNGEASLITGLGGLLIPLVLWCSANWCLTSVADGKGSFKNIYIASCYSLTPLILFMPPLTIISHFLTLDETGIITAVMGVAFAWMALLLFFGMMTTHDYSLPKNMIITIFVIVSMAFMLFLVTVFFNLVGSMVSFFDGIYNELSFRS